MTGKTIGKIFTKTIVTNKSGHKPTLLQIFLRTVVRLIPFEGLSFVFGYTGLHDLLSKTIVTSTVIRKIVLNE